MYPRRNSLWNLNSACLFCFATPILAGCQPSVAAPEAARSAEAAADTPVTPDTHVANGALFSIPAGWRMDGKGWGTVSLTAPGVPSGQSVQIVISAPEKAYSSVRESLEADIANAKGKTSNFRTDSDLEETRHPEGYMIAQQVVSWSSGRFGTGSGLSPFGRSHILICHIGGAGEPALPVMLVAESRELLDSYRPTFDGFVHGLRLANRVQLAPGAAGQPALTLETAHRFDSTLEWLLETKLTAAQRYDVHRYLVGAWERGDAGEMKGVLGMPDMRQKVEAMPAEQRALVRQVLRSESLKSWRADAKGGDAGAKIVLGIYYGNAKPLVAGTKTDPPLTREVAEAMLNTLYFMASMSVDPSGLEVHPPDALREKWTHGFIAQWKTLSPAEKEGMCLVPGLSANLRLGWANMGAAEKAKGSLDWAKAPPVKLIAQQIRADRAKMAGSGRLQGGSALGKAHESVNLYNQLSAYGALRINHTYIKW